MRIVIALMLSILVTAAHAETTQNFDCKNFFNFDHKPEAVRKDFMKSPETMAWNWFVCLNQPVSTTKDRVWETLKPTDQVLLADGAKPTPYDSRTPLPEAVKQAAQAEHMDLARVFHDLDSTQQVDGLILEMGGQVPAAQRGQPVRYQLLMERNTFDYILKKDVYNVNGLSKLTADLDFPADAWELKTSWIWIGTDRSFLKTMQADGYYIGQAYYRADGRYHVGYAALSGMHIINKLVPDWVWITFENKNNDKYTVTNDVPPAPMTNSTGPTAAAQPVNASFQTAHPSLSHYELIGVQYQAGQPPVLLANSQLESAFQSQSSCLACHSTAAYSKEKGFFNFALPEHGGIAYPTKLLPPSAFDGYHKLDFVWSLKRAQWKR